MGTSDGRGTRERSAVSAEGGIRTNSATKQHHDYLRRLPPESYRGFAVVHWSRTLDGRRAGWLTQAFHWRFRELLTHALARYYVACPTYCLMPDHMHVLWMGLAERTDQRLAIRFFREHVNRLLANPTASHVAEFVRIPLPLKPRFKLQKQPHDHVLRSQERERGALAIIALYIMENPVREGLVRGWKGWEFSGGVMVGYPNLDPRQEDYWQKFWLIRERLASTAS